MLLLQHHSYYDLHLFTPAELLVLFELEFRRTHLYPTDQLVIRREEATQPTRATSRPETKGTRTFSRIRAR